MSAERGCHDDDRPPSGDDHVGTPSVRRGEASEEIRARASSCCGFYPDNKKALMYRLDLLS